MADASQPDRDYVFFFSYIQPPPKPGQSLWSNAEEMCEVNGNNPITTSLVFYTHSFSADRYVRDRPATAKLPLSAHISFHTPKTVCAPDRSEKLRRSPRSNRYPTHRIRPPRYHRTKLLLHTRRYPLRILQAKLDAVERHSPFLHPRCRQGRRHESGLPSCRLRCRPSTPQTAVNLSRRLSSLG